MHEKLSINTLKYDSKIYRIKNDLHTKSVRLILRNKTLQFYNTYNIVFM